MAAVRAALGFRLHTGWAAVVAVSGQRASVNVLLRKRIELLPGDGSIPRFVYHAAAEMDAAASAELVKRAASGAQKVARSALTEILEELRQQGVTVNVAGIPTGSTAVPSELAKILGAHPLIHAAEGELFLKAAAGACERCGLNVVTARERELWERAAAVDGMDAVRLRRKIDELRQSVGAPWSADQKIATAAALLALGTTGVPRGGSRAPSTG